MPTAAPTQPTPPTGPEIKLGGSGNASRVDPKVLEAANALAAKNAPQAEALPEPSPDPAEPPKEPVKPNAVQADPPKEPTKPATPPAEEPKGVKQLREAYERAQKKSDELNGSLTATTAEKAAAMQKLADLEAKHTRVMEELEKDYKPRAAKLAEVEKKLIEKEEILRIRDYQSTEEFHNQFVKPIADAHAEAAGYMAQLTVTDGEGHVRQATTDDLNEILATRSLNDAAALAQQKFGPLIASTIVNMKVRISGLERSRQEAVKNAGIHSAEWVKNQQIAMSQQREQFRNSVLAEANRLISESPHLKLADDDNDGKATIGSATQFADSLWEENPNQTPEQVARKLAKVRLDVVEAPLLRSKVSKMQERIKELETRLSDYEASEPNMAPRGAGAQIATAKPGDEAKQKMLAAAQALAAKRG